MSIDPAMSAVILQLAFPAALQLMSILIPLLYALRAPKLQELLGANTNRVFKPLIGAFLLAVTLYLMSAILLFVNYVKLSSGTIASDMIPFVHLTVADGLDIVTLLACFAFFIAVLYLGIETVISRREQGEKGPVGDEPISDIIRRITHEHRSRLSLVNIAIWKSAVTKFQTQILHHELEVFNRFGSVAEEYADKLVRIAGHILIVYEEGDPYKHLCDTLKKHYPRFMAKLAKRCGYTGAISRSESGSKAMNDEFQKALAATALLLLSKRVYQESRAIQG